MNKLKAWISGLTAVGRISVLAVIVLGGMFTVSAVSPPTPAITSSVVTETTKIEPIVTKKVDPVVTTKTETKTEIIPFTEQTVESNDLAKGQTQIQTEGVNGVKTITYTITLTGGVETNRTPVEAITAEPVSQVTVIGTYVKPVSNCDPNYSGCVPIASDVDCAGGSGNGPAYVIGPVKVVGRDIYDLDRDGNGWGCE